MNKTIDIYVKQIIDEYREKKYNTQLLDQMSQTVGYTCWYCGSIPTKNFKGISVTYRDLQHNIEYILCDRYNCPFIPEFRKRSCNKCNKSFGYNLKENENENEVYCGLCNNH